MKKNDLLTIATAAIATAALTVAIFGGGSTKAGNDSAAMGAPVVQPKLNIQGVELSLVAADSRVFHAGEQPAFELRAVNTNSQSADVGVCVTMTAASPVSVFSRVVRMPVALWTTNERLKLDARESKTFTLNALTNLPENSLITLRLSDPILEADQRPSPFLQPGIVALSFSTVTNVAPGSEPNLTLAR